MGFDLDVSFIKLLLDLRRKRLIWVSSPSSSSSLPTRFHPEDGHLIGTLTLSFFIVLIGFDLLSILHHSSIRFQCMDVVNRSLITALYQTFCLNHLLLSFNNEASGPSDYEPTDTTINGVATDHSWNRRSSTASRKQNSHPFFTVAEPPFSSASNTHKVKSPRHKRHDPVKKVLWSASFLHLHQISQPFSIFYMMPAPHCTPSSHTSHQIQWYPS